MWKIHAHDPDTTETHVRRSRLSQLKEKKLKSKWIRMVVDYGIENPFTTISVPDVFDFDKVVSVFVSLS